MSTDQKLNFEANITIKKYFYIYAQLSGFRCRFIGVTDKVSLPEITQNASYYRPLGASTRLSFFTLSELHVHGYVNMMF